MAHNNNKKSAFIAFAMMSPFFTSPAWATTEQPVQQTAYTVSTTSFLNQSVQKYFPQAAPVFTSFMKLSIDLTTAVGKQNTVVKSVASSVVQPEVIQAAIKPANVPAQTRPGPAAAAFDTVAVPFKRLAALKKLAPSLDEMNKGTALACRGKNCAPTLAAIKLVGTGMESSLRDKLNAVNAAVNKSITYRSDMEINGVADHWSTPSETLARGQGDCEDFAILKMAALRAQGVDPAAMSIVALFDQKRRLYHAVLSVEISGRHFILDNVRNQVLQDTQLPDYVALYSIRDGKGFLHGSQRQKQIASAITSMEKIAPGAGVN